MSYPIYPLGHVTPLSHVTHIPYYALLYSLSLFNFKFPSNVLQVGGHCPTLSTIADDHLNVTIPPSISVSTLSGSRCILFSEAILIVLAYFLARVIIVSVVDIAYLPFYVLLSYQLYFYSGT